MQLYKLSITSSRLRSQLIKIHISVGIDIDRLGTQIISDWFDQSFLVICFISDSQHVIDEFSILAYFPNLFNVFRNISDSVHLLIRLRISSLSFFYRPIIFINVLLNSIICCLILYLLLQIQVYFLIGKQNKMFNNTKFCWQTYKI